MLKKVSWIILILATVPPTTYAQSLLKTYGTGVLTAPRCAIEMQIPLYETQNGDEPAAFLAQVFEHHENSFVFVDNNGKTVSLHANDALFVSYDAQGLTVFEESDYGYRVALHHEGNTGYWISKKDVKRHHLSHWSWIDYLTSNYITLFPDAIGIPMNLRDQPNANGKKLVTMNSDHYQITPTGRTQALWAEVRVAFYSAPYCEEAELVQEFTGWVKLLDDKGYPNLWFYAKGC